MIEVPTFEKFSAEDAFARDWFTCVTWRIHTCDMTHSYVWHDSFIRATWLVHTCGRWCWIRWSPCSASYVWRDSFIRVTWLLHSCDMTYSYVWHEPFICATWLLHTCDMTHSHVCQNSHLTRQGYGGILNMHECVVSDMTHSYVWHDSFICVIWLLHMCDMTHSYVWHDSSTCVTWHRPHTTRMRK